MDLFLGKVTQQAMNYAIRSGVTITATYAIRQSAKLLKNAPQSQDRDELVTLKQRLQNKINIISPAIDMIELIAARGNTSLESAVSLTKDLRFEIQSLGQRVATAAAAEESSKTHRQSSQARAQNELELKLIISDIKTLLERIEDAVPLINLAITTSGASLSTTLPSTVSPSRLLQASTFLTAGDTQYSLSPHKAVQIGPTFMLSVYMLFAGHHRPQNEEEIRATTWKEVIHKARVKLRRVPVDIVAETGSGSEAIPYVEITSPGRVSDAISGSRIPAEGRADEFAYQVMIIEDLEDDRVHDFEAEEAQPGPFDDVKLAGLREMIPIHELSKIFYADTSKVLNIGTDSETNHPVLLLKRDLNAVQPRRLLERGTQNEEELSPPPPAKQEDEAHTDNDHADRKEDPWRMPPSLDPEWMAFEVYTESQDSDDESELNPNVGSPAEHSQLEDSMSHLNINGTPNKSMTHSISQSQMTTIQPPPWVNAIKTSLSLLELLLRLTSLQQFQQQSHLSINDELLNFFLEESASTGAGGDEHYRQALRADARRRVGFDPYDESPLKRRGEEYQYQHYPNSPSPHLYKHDQSSTWSPSVFQTRSITGVSDDQSPSSIRSSRDRPNGLKQREREHNKSSPLHPKSVDTDEGIATSPGSGAVQSSYDLVTRSDETRNDILYKQLHPQ